ncbi:Gfo/Idh/MocA family protein [Georgenia subflava]|uniref:Gfo/Idh/MocA family oxidoreductase n=1 Tax=Georgenia subflava TaxID=1622177 RepID=A0A6N7EMJ5_9MICO|nr:Gfo/Idh/MocA family oxidoreductase [Georgenia subflava]MPV36464.1 gfo/Idh/MocA family oxidoreductase [Georgenia subflava]
MVGQRIGVGIVGLGAIGATHARALREIDRVDLVAYSGGTTAAASDAGWPDAVQLSPAEVIDHPGVQVVAICTPSDTHAALALDALRAGRHVVVEKPLALRVADAEAVVTEARRRGLVASMIAHRRFEPEHEHVRELLGTGALGELRLARTHVHWVRDDAYYAAAPWRTSMAAGGGSLMNQGAHNVDLLRWLCGEVVEVTAQHATLGHDMDAEDTTVATVRFASGALGVITTSTATPPGDEASIVLHLSGGTVELGQGTVLRWDVPGVPAPGAADDGAASGARDPGAIGHSGHLTQWRDVVDAIDSGRAPAIDVADAAKTVRLLCAVYEAAASGRAVNPADL